MSNYTNHNNYIGLFHIVLEYALKHSVYPSIDNADVLCCCFKLLQGIAASNGEVRFLLKLSHHT